MQPVSGWQIGPRKKEVVKRFVPVAFSRVLYHMDRIDHLNDLSRQTALEV